MALQALSWGLILVCLYLVSQRSYLLFHSLAELFSITVAFGLFIVTWNARRFLSNNYLLFIGLSYFFVAFIDSLHTLAYKGMGVFARDDANLPTQLWIIARYMQSLSLLVAPLFLRRRPRIPLVLAVYSLATILALLSVFAWAIFPDCFLEGKGLTPFKLASEYVICLLLGASILVLLRNRQSFDPQVLGLVSGSLSITIISEVAFTRYVSVYGLSNFVGHYAKILAFYLMYKAIIETGLARPFRLLFRELKQSEQALLRMRDELELRVKERTAQLAEINEEIRTEVRERRRTETALLAYTRQLEAVRDISVEITRELDLTALVQLIARRAGELVGAATGTVWLWDEGAEVLRPQASLGHQAWMQSGALSLGQGAAGVVAQRREGLVVNDYRTWPQALPVLLEHSRITSVVAEPLLYHDRLLGVVAVDNEQAGRQFTEEDRGLLQLFATHIAIAIENARLFREVRESHERLQRLSRQLVEIQEAERRQIARELHDEIGQALTGLKLLLGMERDSPPERRRARYTEAQELAQELLTRVRALSLDLRPAMLDDLGLLAALLWQAERFGAQTGIRIRFEHTGIEGRRFPPEMETAAYRVVQEALTNVARHAGAEEGTARLWADELVLGVQVEDRGKGFLVEPTLAAQTSTGLLGMRERAELLGGRLTVESTPGKGTRVTVEFPLPPAGHAGGRAHESHAHHPG